MSLPQRKITNAVSAFDTYLQMTELTESPLIFHRWSFISAVSTLLARNVWFPFGEQIIYPNQYIVLVGPPGTRKSSAINSISSLITSAGYEHFGPNKSSMEKFMLDWAFGLDKIFRGIEPGKGNTAQGGLSSPDVIEEIMESSIGLDKNKISEAYIKSGELQNFFKGSISDFIVVLTDLWDNLPKYTDRVKNSESLYIPNPTLNLLGGATITTFASMFSSSIVGQGMLSRLILVYGGKQRMRLTIPPAFSPELKNIMVDFFRTIKTNIRGPLTLSQEAAIAIDYIYQNWVDLPDSRLITYGGRRLDHLIKLILICAVCDFRTEVIIDDVILANTILSYTELYMPKALGEFGKSKNSEVSQVVLDTITQGESVGGYSAREIFKNVGQDIDNMNELVNILVKLTSAGKIRSVEREDIPVYLPVKRKVNRNTKYVEFDLLYEYKFKEAE